jgi:hypothetical protein
MKPGKVKGKDITTTSAASAPYSLPGMSGGRSISGKENNMKTKNVSYTPGPWTVGGWGEIYGPGVKPMSAAGPLPTAKLVCKMSVGTSVLGVTNEEGSANARLIAAAPDLLAALKSINLNDLTRESDAKVRAAIAKAEGK